MVLFAFATLCPFVLVLAAALIGGAIPLVALGYMTALVFGMDRLIRRQVVNAPAEAEFPAARALLIVLAFAHMALWPITLWAVAGPSGLDVGQRVMVAITAGLIFGQISHPVAHELIHQPGRLPRLLGQVMYSTLLVGHHTSAHLHVHHVHVGTDADPNSPRRGRGFYRYALSAGVGSYLAALRAENARMQRAGRPVWRHPFVLYTGAALASAMLALWGFGPVGFAVFVALSIYAQMQILLSDYVQHYGLRRKTLEGGRAEPVGPQHSWNTPHWYSSAMMVNAPRHSDHHVTPNRPYPALQLDEDAMPMLPLPLPMMATIALVPPLWRRVMDKRAERWA